MKYDFDKVTDRRNSGSVKWDLVKKIFGSPDVLPMWVADMDFPIAEPITEALRRRVKHPFYGYTYPTPSLLKAIAERMKRKYSWQVKPEWIIFTPGVVPALNAAIRALTHPGDGVIIQEPVYYPFYPAITDSGCQVVLNPLRLVDGRYVADIEHLKSCFASRELMRDSISRAKVFILCNPHNPVGRVWSKEEISKIGKTAIDNGAAVISDEVHCELLFRGSKHTPFASISEEFAQNSIVCMSASKAFNLAGLAASAIIIPNENLRNAFIATKTGIMPQPDTMALAALEAAFRDGDEWLGQMLEYVQRNLEFLLDYFKKKIPRIRVIRPEGTYLVWLDCRELGLGREELRDFFREKAKLGLDDGYLFGPGGEGFQRMNIACPRCTLEKALDVLEQAVNGIS